MLHVQIHIVQYMYTFYSKAALLQYTYKPVMPISSAWELLSG